MPMSLVRFISACWLDSLKYACRGRVVPGPYIAPYLQNYRTFFTVGGQTLKPVIVKGTGHCYVQQPNSQVKGIPTALRYRVSADPDPIGYEGLNVSIRYQQVRTSSTSGGGSVRSCTMVTTICYSYCSILFPVREDIHGERRKIQ